MNILKSYRLSKTLVEQIRQLAEKTHRTEKFYVEEAIRSYLDSYIDAQIAKDRFNDPKRKVISSKEMRARLGV